MPCFLPDPEIRFGIKFGLAGVLTIFLALLLRLHNPTWALFTVLVLMIAQYVGAIAEKSVLRLIGTLIGGIIGYLLTGSLEQEPVLFLLSLGLLVTFCTAMFGQNNYPYAFLLCALTASVVASNGLSNPEDSWSVALFRTIEICLGIVVTLLVNCLVWPSYARDAFREKFRAAFADIENCFARASRILTDGPDDDALRLAETFPQRISALRILLNYGARESRYFSQRLPIYGELITHLSHIATAIRTLGSPLPPTSFYGPRIQSELAAVHAALTAALHDLSLPAENRRSWDFHATALDAAFHQLEARIHTLRSTPGAEAIPTEEAFTFALHTLAIDEIRGHLERVHELIAALANPAPPPRPPGTGSSWMPPTFWIHNGIKGGLAVVLAMILINWLNPPGSSLLALGAWVFTVLNPVAPGGQGDRRAFHSVAILSFVVLLASLGLIAFAPLLSSYAVLNIFLFTALFLWGYTFLRIGGISVGMQIAMLLIVSTVGLNAQEPVSFPDILNVFFGISLALVLAACIQRLIWPSLPQRELRDRLAEYVAGCQLLVADGIDRLPLPRRVRLALIPGEARTYLTRLEHPQICAADSAHLDAYLSALRKFATHLFGSAGHLAPILQGTLAAEGRQLIAEMEKSYAAVLATHHAILTETPTPPAPTHAFEETLARWSQWILDLRLTVIREDLPVATGIRVLGLAARYERAGRDLLEADSILTQLDIPTITGDYAL